MTPATPQTAAGRTFLWVNVAIYAAFALTYFVVPELAAARFDIRLQSPAALADIRAVYGGLSLASSVFFVYGIRRVDWYVPALFLATIAAAGLAGGRLYSWAASGAPNQLISALLMTELVGALWGVILLRTERGVLPGGGSALYTDRSGA